MESYHPQSPSSSAIEDKAPFRICIAGFGIAGATLCALLIKYLKQYPEINVEIILVEKRSLEQFDRRQKIIIYPGTILEENEPTLDAFIFDLLDLENDYSVDEDGDLCKKNKKLKNLTKAEKLLFKILNYEEKQAENRYTNFSIRQLQQVLMEYIDETVDSAPNIKLQKYPFSVIEQVDSQHKKILIKTQNGKQVVMDFNVFAICEGERRDTIKIVNEDLVRNKIFPYTFKPATIQPPPYHCAVRLKFKPLTEIEEGRYGSYQECMQAARKKYDENEKLLFDNHMQELGWYDPQYPEVVIEENQLRSPSAKHSEFKHSEPRLFVASEIPESIYKITDNEKRQAKIIKWAIALAARILHYPESYLEVDRAGEEKELKLNAIAFTVNLQQIDSLTRLLNDCVFTVMGDAARSPLYPVGFSSTMALQQVVKFVDSVLVFLLKKKLVLNEVENVYAKQTAAYDLQLQINYLLRRDDLTNNSYKKIVNELDISKQHQIDKETYDNYLTALYEPVTYGSTFDKNNDELCHYFYKSKNENKLAEFIEKCINMGSRKLNLLFRLFALQELIRDEKDVGKIKNYEIFIKKIVAELQALLPKEFNQTPGKFKLFLAQQSQQYTAEDYYVSAMFARYVKQHDKNTQDFYINNLLKADKEGYTLAKLELANYYQSIGEYGDAIFMNLELTQQRVSASYINIVELLLTDQIFDLPLFIANWFLFKSSLHPAFDDSRLANINSKIADLEWQLKQVMREGDLISKVAASLDLAMNKELLLQIDHYRQGETSKSVKVINTLINVAECFQYLKTALQTNQTKFFAELPKLINIIFAKLHELPDTKFLKDLKKINTLIETCEFRGSNLDATKRSI